jgi:hypothetical protein
LANATNDNITGTSTKTPTTVTNAAGDCKPNNAIATATANSKKLLAPIIADGEQMACGNFNFRPPNQVMKNCFYSVEKNVGFTASINHPKRALSPRSGSRPFSCSMLSV